MIADALCDGSTCDLLLHRGSLSWQHERSGLHTYLPIRCAALHTNHACGTVKYPFDLTRTDSGKGYNLVVKLGEVITFGRSWPQPGDGKRVHDTWAQ